MNKKTMFAIAFAAIAGPACSNDPAPPTTDKPTLDTRPAHVTLTFYVDQEKAGTCSGVLLAARVVMTGAHCVAGKTAAWVKAPYANDQTTWSTKAVVYDWTDTATPESHPHHTDVAILYLDDDITIPKYPTVATSPVRDGGNVSIVRRGFKSGEKTRAFLKFAAAAKSARARGFPNDYQTQHDSKLVDTGGPAYSGDRVIGIVSGRGASTGSLYIARLDRVASWIGDQVIHAPQKTESGSASSSSSSSSSGGSGAMPMGDGGKMDGGMADAGPPKKIPTPPSGTMSDPKGTPQMPSGGGSMGGMGGSSSGGMGTMSGGSSGGGDHGSHGGSSGSSGSSGSTDDHGDHGSSGTSGSNGTDENNPCSCTTPDQQTDEHGDDHGTTDETTSGGATSGGEDDSGGMTDCGEGMCSDPGTDYGDNGTGNVDGGDDGGWGGDYDSGGDYGDYGGDGYGDDAGGWDDGGGDYGD